MIREFAVEPAVMATWQHFQSLFHQFGVGQGRMISEFPSKWRKTLFELVEDQAQKGVIGPNKAKAICEKVAASRERFCSAGGRTYDTSSSATWLKNAMAFQTSQPFAGIVVTPESCVNPTQGVLVAGDFDPDSAPWKVDRQAKVLRTTSALTQCARLLLLNSKELVLVEPNFDATETRFLEPLIEFIAAAGEGKSWRRCELHTAVAKLAGSQENRSHNLVRYLKNALPRGASIFVYFWQRKSDGERLHPRYLLTELGGLMYDYGLDKGEAGETTIVTLLDQCLWEQLRRDYCADSTTFEAAVGSPILVKGSS